MSERTADLIVEAARAMDTGLALFDRQGRYLFINEALAGINGVAVEDHAGRTLEDVVGDLAGPVRAAHERVWATGAPGRDVDMEGELPADPGHQRRWHVSHRLVGAGSDRAIATTVTEITREHEAGLDSRRRSRQQASLAHLAAAALQGTPTGPVLDDAMRGLAVDLEVDVTAVGVVTDDRDAVVLRAGAGWAPNMIGRYRREIEPEGPLRETLATTAPHVIDDFAADPRFPSIETSQKLGLVAGLAITIHLDDRPWGLMIAASRRHRTFSDDDLRHLTSLAGLIASAVTREAHQGEIEKRAEQRRRLISIMLSSVEDERRRIAEVLHDQVLQDLLFARQECSASGAVHQDEGLARAAKALEAATGTLRRLVGEVHPIALGYSGLSAAVTEMARELADRGRYSVTAQVAPMAEGVMDALLLGMARELLTNVGKHAGAKHAEVSIFARAQELVLSVRDDGCGLDPGLVDRALSEGHIGLRSVIERVEALGGAVTFGSGPHGSGTSVYVRIPR